MSIEAAILLLAALIVGVATLFAVLFQRFEGRLETRIDRLEGKIEMLRQEFAAMEGSDFLHCIYRERTK
jgi:hypothetical protein